MRGWLFAVLILTVVLAVLITVVGLLANWGIWIKSDLVEAGKELPLLNVLVTGVLIACVGFAIDVGRRWFVASKAMEELPKLYLDLLSAAIVIPTTAEEEADANFTIVSDHFAESYANRDEELKHTVRVNLAQAVARMKSVRYGGAKATKVVAEVLPGGGK